MIQLVIFLALCFPEMIFAAPSVDNTDSLEGTTAAVNKNVTVGGSVNLAMVFVCERDIDSSGFTGGSGGVTIGGSAATQLTAITDGDGLTRIVPFYKLAPVTGTVNFAVTPDTGTDIYVAGIVVLNASDQTGTFGTEVTSSNTGSQNADVDGIASSVGELMIGAGCVRTSTSTPSPDSTAPISTEIIDVEKSGATSVRVFVYTENGASPTGDIRVDLTASERWSMWGASIRGVEGHAFGPLRRRGMQ